MDTKKRNVLIVGAIVIVILVVILSTGVFNPTGGVIMTGGAIGIGEDYGSTCIDDCVRDGCGGLNDTCFEEFGADCVVECNN